MKSVLMILLISITAFQLSAGMTKYLSDIKLKKNLHVKTGEIKMLKNKAKITTKTKRKIIIEDGGTLRIQKGAACTLDVKIEIHPGGKLEFEENTLAWIDENII